VLQMQPRLSMLVEEPWWEVAAALGRVCCTLLILPGAAAAAEAPALVQILLTVLGNRNPRVLATVLPLCAALLPFQPPLASPFVAALLEIPSKEREFVLSSSASWPSLAVAEALLSEAKQQQLENLVSAHAEVLCAVLSTPLDPRDREGWQAWLKANKDYLYVGLCDEDLCKNISTALLPLFALLQELALPTFSTLFSSLRMLCGPDYAACQGTADELLVALVGLGDPVAGAIAKLVAEFEPQMRSALPQSVQMVGA